jgi:hypothetical protein
MTPPLAPKHKSGGVLRPGVSINCQQRSLCLLRWNDVVALGDITDARLRAGLQRRDHHVLAAHALKRHVAARVREDPDLPKCSPP